MKTLAPNQPNLLSRKDGKPCDHKHFEVIQTRITKIVINHRKIRKKEHEKVTQVSVEGKGTCLDCGAEWRPY